MSGKEQSNKRTRILDAAEQLFSDRGYDSVSVRDIAVQVGVNHATLYHHFPRGKEQLYIEVMERTLAAHRDGLTLAIAGAEADLTAQFYAVVEWLVMQPPPDLAHMQRAEAHALDPAAAERLQALVYESMTSPITAALGQASEAGQIRWVDTGMAAMALVTLVLSVHQLPDLPPRARVALGRKLADLLLLGIVKR
jgi:AcrR family transcriptional regulator